MLMIVPSCPTGIAEMLTTVQSSCLMISLSMQGTLMLWKGKVVPGEEENVGSCNMCCVCMHLVECVGGCRKWSASWQESWVGSVGSLTLPGWCLRAISCCNKNWAQERVKCEWLTHTSKHVVLLWVVLLTMCSRCWLLPWCADLCVCQESAGGES